MTTRLHHVSIPVPEDGFATARAFYGTLLGLHEVPPPEALDPARFCWYDLGGTELHLFAETDANQSVGRHLALAVDDLARLRERLAKAGVPCEETTPIVNRPRCFVRDPFGNRIELTQIRGPYR